MGQDLPIWMTKNEKLCCAACEAVRKMTDQKQLARAATEAPLWEVRKAAVKRLCDQALLAQIALSDSNQYVRKAAERRLRELSGNE